MNSMFRQEIGKIFCYINLHVPQYSMVIRSISVLRVAVEVDFIYWILIDVVL